MFITCNGQWAIGDVVEILEGLIRQMSLIPRLRVEDCKFRIEGLVLFVDIKLLEGLGLCSDCEVDLGWCLP